MMDVPIVVLNDDETWTSIDGTTIIAPDGMAYSLARLWHACPLSIREAAREGMASARPTLWKVNNDLREQEVWPDG